LRSFKKIGDGWPQWWRDCFRKLNPKQIRKLLKTPTMTFAYSATQGGMADGIMETYAGLFDGILPTQGAAIYLAGKVMEACRELLCLPASVMQHIRDLAGELADRGEFLGWRSPTGLPVINFKPPCRKRVLNVRRHGVPIQFTIANYEPGVDKRGAQDAAAPNFVHSLDAAHLIRIVIAAAAESIEVIPIHDSFSVLAPDAVRFGKIARREMAMPYAHQDHLTALGIKLPAYGQLDPLEAQHAEWMFS
jgi:DNA-directed RNA polymerase